MAAKDNFDEDKDLDLDDDSIDDEVGEVVSRDKDKMNPVARRRLEELQEQKALKDLLDDDFDSYLADL